MFTLAEPPLFARLRDARSVLIAGAGGGFDVFAGLPLGIALTDAGKRAHFANLSFVTVDHLPSSVRVAPGLAAVRSDTPGNDDYFPERALAMWLSRNGFPDTVYAFAKTGVKPLRALYRRLVRDLDIDAIVLVDGGTDILMRGDEASLGTPEEDMASLAAVAGVDVPVRLVASLGFGIDAYHGICHAQVLENLAALSRSGHYLGALSIPRESREGTLFLDAVAYANRVTPRRPSIVQGSVGAALTGRFGDAHFTERTGNSELFINPLMSVYFTVDLAGLAERSLYLDRLEGTRNIWEVSSRIAEFRDELPSTRPRRAIPH
ncbi:hypothetical protein B4N89_24620 [Embleya scabrispora]|uniref:DUF1152 domain-containing protein n=1 Tax=Embleya scabrispora TaxID=159449 RepID=A0A1T3P3M2_9ACTN|nr:DUF1152 domain-containing protein [Embleya scabrispora]OPC83699.1 hypothetical protein B4N89_24620 [Embleya scabrispora]